MKIFIGLNADIPEIQNAQDEAVRTFGDFKPGSPPHITLKAPVECDPDRETAKTFHRIAKEIASKYKSFLVSIPQYNGFPSVVFAEVEENDQLKSLFNTFNRLMYDAGIKLGKFEIERVPHITIAKGFKSKGITAQEIINHLNGDENPIATNDVDFSELEINSISVYTKDSTGKRDEFKYDFTG